MERSSRRDRRVSPRRAADAVRKGGPPFVMLTAYDATTAAVLEEAGVTLLLVGDSVGNTHLGYATTLPVTLEVMLHHTAAVSRGVSEAVVVADLPFGSYEVDPADGMRAALRLVQEGGAHAVKAEGGSGAVVELAGRLVTAGVPFMGHLGLLPQSVRLTGYRMQGRGPAAAKGILEQAQALAEAGAFAIVLEAVPAELAAEVTAAVAVPTIGIGAGGATDGQVLVIDDLLGRTAEPPGFARRYADLRTVMRAAVEAFAADVASGAFPSADAPTEQTHRRG